MTEILQNFISIPKNYYSLEMQKTFIPSNSFTSIYNNNISSNSSNLINIKTKKRKTDEIEIKKQRANKKFNTGIQFLSSFQQNKENSCIIEEINDNEYIDDNNNKTISNGKVIEEVNNPNEQQVILYKIPSTNIFETPLLSKKQKYIFFFIKIIIILIFFRENLLKSYIQKEKVFIPNDNPYQIINFHNSNIIHLDENQKYNEIYDENYKLYNNNNDDEKIKIEELTEDDIIDDNIQQISNKDFSIEEDLNNNLKNSSTLKPDQMEID